MTGPARGLLRFAAALAAVLAVPRCGPAAGTQEDPATACFRGGPAHGGVYAPSGAPETPAVDGVRFRVATEGPVRSSPAVAGGRVYFGSADGRVYAAGLDGSVLWQADLASPVTSSPAVAGGRVFVQSRAGEVVALAAATGAVEWRFKGGADLPLAWGHESGDVYVSSPAVAAGRVLVGSGDGHLYALDAASGRALWQLATGGRVRSSPAIALGTVYVGSMDGSIYAADLESGRLRWRFDTQGRSLRSELFGFDRKSVQSSPAVVDGTVYCGSRDGFLYALDAASGGQRWRFDHQVSWVIGSPAVWEGRVYVGSSDGGFLQAVDARTGREAWRVRIPGIVWSSPAIAGTTLYVGDGSGTFYAFDARLGQPRFSWRIGSGIFGSPVPAGDAVLVGANDGTLYALGLAAGAGGAPGAGGAAGMGGPAGAGGAAGMGSAPGAAGMGGAPGAGAKAAAGGALRRIVFWDQAYERAAWLHGHAELRDRLAAHGYEVMDAPALAAFMTAAIAGGGAARSVVVFAIDHLPPELAAPRTTGKALLRRYLDARGKVVWSGFPPLIWPREPRTGRMAPYGAIDRLAPQDLLGVDFSAANFDAWGTRVTAAGRAWGLRGWWLAPWSVKPAKDLKVLAFDESGQAAAWVRRYGGGPGTGFVMIGCATPDPATVLAVADYRPSGGAGL
jgi:eukaryotic-like serine/threonine-protein kinase